MLRVMGAGTATVDFPAAAIGVMDIDFTLVETGMSVSLDNPGVAEIEVDTDADRGFNVTTGGTQYLKFFHLAKPGWSHCRLLTRGELDGLLPDGSRAGKRDVNLLVTTDDGNTETVVSPTVAHGMTLVVLSLSLLR